MNTRNSQVDPNILFQQAFQFQQNGWLQDAELMYKNLLQVSPSHIGAKTMLGMLYVQTERAVEGIGLLKSSLIKDPKQYWAHNALGVGLLNTMKFQEAIFSFNKALILKPDYKEAYFNLGKTQRALRNFKDAIISYSKSIEVDKSYADAFNNRGVIYLEDLKEYEHALANFQKYISLVPNAFYGHYNLGNVFKELKRYDDALVSYDRAIEFKPDYAEAYFNRGVTFGELKRYDDALVSYDRAIEFKPDYAEAYFNRGVTFGELKRYDDALVSYDRAIEFKPDYAEAYFNRGVTFGELKRYDDELVSYDRAIEFKPDYAEVYFNRGVTFGELKRYDDALVGYDRANQLKPEMDYLFGNVIHTKMHLCDWRNLDALFNQLKEKIIKHQVATFPFITLAVIDNPELQKKSAEIYINDKYPTSNVLPKIRKYLKHQKIRIGYFSADFSNHPVSYLMAELFELHHRDQFEVIAFSFGVNTNDPMRKRLEEGFDRFIDVRDKSDLQIALLAREIEIDIAVDLGGFTHGARVGVFAMRVAPIQVSYIGYLGTMSAEYMDYLVADWVLIPQDKQKYYSEKIAYLPSYQVNDSQREVAEKIFTREEVGLPENAFVFCCFNNIYKITPNTFYSWMRILNEVNDSVLLLLDANETATKNLKNEATARGIDANRLVFGKALTSPEYLARYRIADLFLDTLPYNAGTTASDALRVGLPVLTQIGGSFASRMAASLLHAVGLPELITASPKAYESLAIQLATNPEQYKRIKAKLVGNLPTFPLYNTKLFTQHLELAYHEMYRRYQDELAADHIYIEN
ncbi:Spy Predicted O-linked N-acetylglucosamine transferase, SPINDLY family [Methylophilaceae bacterium]